MPSEPVELGRALTGEELPLTARGGRALAAELAALGFDRDRLGALRRQRQETRQPWPFPVDVEARRTLGFARFDARLTELRQVLGLDGQLERMQGSSAWGEAERRLAADRPPHWG